MRQYLLMTVLIPAFFLWSSCIKEIDLEHLRTNPKLVLNSVIVADTPIEVHITRTWFYTDDQPADSIWQADVHLYINGEFKEKMQWKNREDPISTRGFYRADYIPKEGDRIKVTAKVDGYPEISAQSAVPKVIPIGKLALDTLPPVSYYSYYWEKSYRFSVTFNDPPGEKNFYFIRFMVWCPVWDVDARAYTDEYRWANLQIDYEDEPVFDNEVSVLDKILDYGYLNSTCGRVFTDDLFDGETYTLRVKTKEDYGPFSSFGADYGTNGPSGFVGYLKTPKVYFYAFLYTFSSDYYYYMKRFTALNDKTLQKQLIEGGFAEPIPVRSNVENGVGILGTCSLDSIGVLLK